MQVMLVEDNEMLAAAVVKALRTAGFSVNHISRGDQALAALKTSKPDILVLDLGLPGMDGLEMLRQAYAGFGHPAVAPLVQLDHRTFALELFHPAA